jgi:hypothetical protein
MALHGVVTERSVNGPETDSLAPYSGTGWADDGAKFIADFGGIRGVSPESKHSLGWMNLIRTLCS